MKKGNLFSSVICLSALLLISCGSQIKNASVSVSLNSALLSKAFPESLINSRAAEAEPLEEGERYSAKFKVSGDYSYEETQNFTKENGISFELKNLTSGITIDISLDLLYNEKILYSGTVKNHVVKAGTNELTLILKPTTEFNPFTQVTISYKSDFGEVAAKVVKIGYQLTEADLPVLEAENMIFVGWFIGDDAAVAGTIIDVDTEIVAKWSEVVVEPEPEITTAKVTFVYGAETEEKEFDIGYVLKAEDLPVIDETLLSDFVGWYDEAGIKVEAGYEIKADVKIVAKWKSAKYTVTFDTDGGSEVNPVVVEYAHYIGNDKIKNPSKEGFVFDGWYLNDAVFNMKKVITEDITLKAKWNVIETDFPEIGLTLETNNFEIENGGCVLKCYANDNLVLRFNQKNGNQNGINNQVHVKAIVENITSDNINLSSQIEFVQLMKRNKSSFESGVYTIKVYFTDDNGEIISKNHKDFSFTIIDEVEAGISLKEPCPEFEIINYYDETREGIVFGLSCDYETLLDDFEVSWTVNGQTLSDCSGVIYRSKRFDGRIHCELKSKLVPYSPIRFNDFEGRLNY